MKRINTITAIIVGLSIGTIAHAKTTTDVQTADCVVKVIDSVHPAAEPQVAFSVTSAELNQTHIGAIPERQLSISASFVDDSDPSAQGFSIGVFGGADSINLLGSSTGGFNSNGKATLILSKASQGQDIWVSCQKK